MKRLRVLIVAVLPVQLLGIILNTSGQQLNVRLLAQTSDNKPLCALDPPSTSVTITAEVGLEAVPPTVRCLAVMCSQLWRVPPTVRCAMKCASVNCRQFNYITGDIQTCQLYNVLPTHFGFQPNCLHFMLPDVDECAVNNGGCHELATCNNTLGSYTCTCKLGYTGNGTYCSVYCPSDFTYIESVRGCYKLVEENSYGDVVDNRCQQIFPTAHALIIRSSAENAEIAKMAQASAMNGCQRQNGKYFWTAGSLDATRRVYYWKTSKYTAPMTYTNWNPGEPTDHDDCVMLMESMQYKWNDAKSSQLGCFMCEIDL